MPNNLPKFATVKPFKSERLIPYIQAAPAALAAGAENAMEQEMKTWIGRIAALALAAALIPASVAPASAHGHGHGRGGGFGAGVAAGIIGLGVLGAIEADREREYYESGLGPNCRPGPMACRSYAPPCFHDEYGAYICPPPERRCFRRAICD